ncbi:MAG: aldolase/citrate lyase family protein [Brachymonas sp.]|nr:aldolase/citrate lyase family protein [Brachymonas sp.]
MQNHPREVLLGAQARTGQLPVCDHYSGIPSRMVQSLQLQAELTQEFGTCVIDVTLDCEDGAPVGREADHAALVADLAAGSADNARVAVRVHPLDHPAFADDVRILLGKAAGKLRHIMVPKVESYDEVERIARQVDDAGGSHIPLHVLVESPLAVHRAFTIASHPRVASISFGLMDFISSHGGAIPDAAMQVDGQFSHPLVVQAKLQIASACHAYGKTPSHCVVTEFNNDEAIARAAVQASRQLGFTRMWSIHPSQIRPILGAFAPNDSAVLEAAEIIAAGHKAHWAPISHNNRLHDRASYRYYWQVLERAHATGKVVPVNIHAMLGTDAG